MACHSPHTTETMTGPVDVTVLYHIKERGGTITVITPTSMGCISMDRVTSVVLHGFISMPLQEVGSHFAILTWSWEGVTNTYHVHVYWVKTYNAMQLYTHINCTHKLYTLILRLCMLFFSTLISSVHCMPSTIFFNTVIIANLYYFQNFLIF